MLFAETTFLDVFWYLLVFFLWIMFFWIFIPGRGRHLQARRHPRLEEGRLARADHLLPLLGILIYVIARPKVTPQDVRMITRRSRAAGRSRGLDGGRAREAEGAPHRGRHRRRRVSEPQEEDPVLGDGPQRGGTVGARAGLPRSPGWKEMPVATTEAPRLSDEQVSEMLALTKDADSVELKLTVEADGRLFAPSTSTRSMRRSARRSSSTPPT